MKISQRNAAKIVEEISRIIGERVNLMNNDGVIIASSDPDRIGTFHAAAKEMIDRNLSEITVFDTDRYEGALPGVNLVIHVKDQVAGVIGVTGPYNEVAKYGQIIKKMTEILLLDQYFAEQKSMDQRIQDRYVDEWMFGDPKNITPSFVERGKGISIDITLPRRVIAISFTVADGGNDTGAQRNIDRAYHQVRRYFERDSTAVFHHLGSELLCAVQDDTDEHFQKQLDELLILLDKYPVCVHVGVDGRSEGYLFMHSSVIKAQKALRTAMRSPSRTVRFYAGINMEIFQSELSANVKMEYIRRIFKSYSVEEIDRWIALLEIFYEEEGSITRTAERLFLHKNTLQYKLNKLRDQTGYDPRSIRYSSLFYNAIHFYRDVRDLMVFHEK